MESITITTSKDREVVDITDEAQTLLRKSKKTAGLCHLFLPHSTAGLTTAYISPELELELIDFLPVTLPHFVEFGKLYEHSHVATPCSKSRCCIVFRFVSSNSVPREKIDPRRLSTDHLSGAKWAKKTYGYCYAYITEQEGDTMKKQKMTLRLSKVRAGDISKNRKLLTSKTPQREGEESFIGHMPDVESDDNALDIEHAMGLRLNEDEEHPKPLNIASDIDKAEEYKRTH